jgi:hypothetical protein
MSAANPDDFAYLAVDDLQYTVRRLDEDLPLMDCDQPLAIELLQGVSRLVKNISTEITALRRSRHTEQQA